MVHATVCGERRLKSFAVLLSLLDARSFASARTPNAPSPRGYTLHEFKDYAGKTQLAISSDGRGSFAGPVVSSSGTSNFKDAVVAGEISAKRAKVESAIEVSSVEATRLKVTGTTNVGDLVTGSDVKVGGVLNTTGDASVRGNFLAGSVTTKGKVEAKTVACGEVKAPLIESSGSIRSPDLEVKDSLEVGGVLKASQAEFTGDVKSSRKLIITDATAKRIVSDRIEVAENFKCAKEALFSDGLKTAGDVTVKGSMEVRDNVVARKLTLSDSLEVMSVKLSEAKGARKGRIDASGGMVLADDINAANSIKTITLTTQELLSSGPISSKALLSSSNISSTELHVSSKAYIGQLDAKSVKASRDITADGKITSAGTLTTKSDCIVDHKLTATKAEIRESFKASDISVSGDISASGTVTANSGLTTRGRIIASRMESGVIVAADKVQAPSANVTEGIVAKKISADVISVKKAKVGEISEAQNSTVSHTLTVGREAVIKGNVTSTGSIRSKFIETSDFRTTGNIDVEADAFITGALKVSGSMEGKSAEWKGKLKAEEMEVSKLLSVRTGTVRGDFSVLGNSMVSGMKITSESAEVNGTLSVVSSTTIGGDMLVLKSLTASNVSANGQLNAKSIATASVLSTGDIITEGLVKSNQGFQSSNGTLLCENITATGTITSRDGLATSNISASGHIHSDSLHAGSLVVESLNATQTSLEDLRVSTASVIDNFTAYGNGTIEDTLTVGEMLRAKEAQIEKGINSRSVFASRVYTEDLAASGFVSAMTIVAKEDAKVHGELTADKIFVTNVLRGEEAKIESAFSCKTATVAGILDAAGVRTRKVSVSGELTLGEVDVQGKLEEIADLQARMEKLEALVKELAS